ncbi:MAG: STN domain-containing protein [Lentisphaerae bacterium]|jgi:hypothetical protein|nr:STN domain-containing protein [Lentisphaerota bacterium]MBT4816586.1 STN domain-containing protein [Lentisphaerota bacterium]MBT5609479.1 STN domain-containing protein [Lentisphaerota bacterium]MBT7057710.1 STN domain-containing protein [Lentisphaerota bacterium]MBT7848659.1 STN domain-containing protein [Lentisphaerota bacterium]
MRCTSVTVERAVGMLVLGLAVLAGAQTSTQQGVTVQPHTGRIERGPKAILEKRMRSIRIPALAVDGMAAQDVFALLVRRARELDPAKRGVNLFYKCDQTSLMRAVSFSFKDLSLAEAMLYTCKACGLDYVVEDHAVIVFRKTNP